MICIAEIFDSSKSVSSSKLVALSGLNSEELGFFVDIWTNADLERRQEIISQLMHLSEADLKLNFTSVFALFLRDSDETIRVQAVVGLEGEGNYLLIKPLVQALKKDTSARVRTAAAIALGKFALQGELDNLPSFYREKAYKALLEILENKTESTEVKRRALEAISPFSLPRVKELIETAYHADDIKLRASAIYAMGRNCDLAWLPTLLIELNNDDPEIRYEAASACGELGAEEAVPHLLEMIADEDQQVQEAAIKALGEICNEQAKDALGKLIKNPQPGIRNAAKSALKEIQYCEDPLSLQR
ncbi:MAG: HEAT repeat domain-containing protein [Dehalococcoidia bacterium]|nr:HEAT repeat domain-containing protein [Dehalococcoidia bacterium]